MLSLYRPDIATMERGESIYNQDDATGFIKLNFELRTPNAFASRCFRQQALSRQAIREPR